MQYFKFPKQTHIDSELQKQQEGFLTEIKPIGDKIVKLAESEEVEALHELVHEAYPLLKFLKDRVYDAFIGALYLKNEKMLQYFCEKGLSLKEAPLDGVVMEIVKLSKWNSEDPPFEILNLLIKYGASVDYIENKKYRTPIFYACKHGNLVFVKILAENNADLNVVDINKKLPLNYVDDKIKKLPNEKIYKEIKEFLVSKGAKDDWKY